MYDHTPHCVSNRTRCKTSRIERKRSKTSKFERKRMQKKRNRLGSGAAGFIPAGGLSRRDQPGGSSSYFAERRFLFRLIEIDLRLEHSIAAFFEVLLRDLAE